jgi:predicted AAA+ superfamily ATPase
MDVSDMHGYIPRLAEKTLTRALDRSPAVAILGPRQCGKSTLAHELLSDMDAVYDYSKGITVAHPRHLFR